MAEPRSATELALRALSVRDRTAAELDARLAEQGVEHGRAEEALGALAAPATSTTAASRHARAASLAERGSGDALIRDDLARRGLSRELVEEAVDGLEPERDRAERIVARRGPSPKTARYLASRGFGEDTIEGVVARDTGGAIG